MDYQSMLQSKKNMSIASFKENLIRQSPFFSSKVLPAARLHRQKTLERLCAFQLPTDPLARQRKQSKKQDKKRNHNSHGKVTRRTLQMLRNEAMALRKNITLKAITDQSIDLQPQSKQTNGKDANPEAQKEVLSVEKAVLPLPTLKAKALSPLSTSAILSSPMENSKHDSQSSTLQSSTHPKQCFKILQFEDRTEAFEVVRYLDSGTFGEVYLVRHMGTGMLLCLKSMRKDQFSTQNLAQLAREVKIQSTLNHPNIIKLYGCTSDSKNFYILMEACLGKNLYKMMAGKAIGETEARGYIQQVCQAVGYLHNLNIIHRDIKPENVLIDHSGTAKLCDFGWAVYAPLLRDTRCGTPLYTPPEMIRSERYDSRVDVWCIGLMTYELLFAAVPFQICSLDDLSRIATDPIAYPSSPNVSQEAEEFMRGCLAKDSEGRFGIRQLLDHDFLQKKKLQFRHTFP